VELFFTFIFFMLGVGTFLAGVIALFHLEVIAAVIAMAIGWGICYFVVYLTS
jgi:hypothetical protein